MWRSTSKSPTVLTGGFFVSKDFLGLENNKQTYLAK
jgi:hypothetical protein